MTAAANGSICAVEDMKHAIVEESHEENLPDGSKVKHKLMRVRSESIDKKMTEKLVKVVEKLKAPKEKTTVEDYETVLPDGTIHKVHKVIKHSVTHIQREHQHGGVTEKVFDGVVKIPGSESLETLETFEKPPHPETIVEQVEEVLPSGKVQKRQIIKNRMVHNIKTRHESIDKDSGQHNEEYEMEEVIPGTETCFYADVSGGARSDGGSYSCSEDESDDDNADGSEGMEGLDSRLAVFAVGSDAGLSSGHGAIEEGASVHEQSDTRKTGLGMVQEVRDDGTVVMKEIVETRTTTTRTLHSRSGSVEKETTESVITEEFITPTPSPRSGSPVEEVK